MKKAWDEIALWIRPVIVTVAGFIIYEIVVVGSLTGIPGKFNSVQVGEKYKVVCNFEIKNSGFRTVEKSKIQLNIPKNASIGEMDIPQKYKYLYKVCDGGLQKDYVVFWIEGLEGEI